MTTSILFLTSVACFLLAELVYKTVPEEDRAEDLAGVLATGGVVGFVVTLCYSLFDVVSRVF